ncbi:hypothetical protein Hypma_015297 [Hypsizygus marmoreus]|uniref:Uncharacterized protein n=1 Tax=Hypsizygus marmoreus TaxID=39966 RepID=A0A369K705_HYPMA|nr:hypothetical protein Hypma_015297 [Hypsizygus marmoreus]
MENPLCLQELVKAQADELLNIRQQLDQSFAQNRLLTQELENLRREKKTSVQPDFESFSSALPGDPHLLKNNAESEIENEFRNGGVGDAVLGPLSTEDNDTISLQPFCSKASPWKFLNQAKKAQLTHASERNSVLIFNDELIFNDGHHNHGTLIKPQFCYVEDAEGIFQKLPYNKARWATIPTQVREVVWHQGPHHFYLGTYAISFSNSLGASDFQALPLKTKREIYALTSNSVKRTAQLMRLPGLYLAGELEALQMTCKRIGFNLELHKCLFKAAGLPVPMANLPLQNTKVSTSSGQFTTTASPVGSNANLPRLHQCEDDVLTVNSQVAALGQASNSPHSYQFMSRKGLKTAKQNGIVYVKRGEFIVDVAEPSQGFEVVSLQRVGSWKEGYPIRELTTDKIMQEQQEIILNRGSHCYHLGTYRPVSTRVLDVNEFGVLPLEAKQKIYNTTAYGDGKKEREANVAENFASGEFQAARVDFERVGLNEEVQRFLEGMPLN